MTLSYKTVLYTAAVALLMAFTYAIVYGAHNGSLTSWHDLNQQLTGSTIMSGEGVRYDFPLHSDEWAHITHAVYLMGGGGLDFVAPQYKRRVFYTDYEPGFDVFLAGVFYVTGADPVLDYKYLPAIFAALGSLGAFILTRHLTGSFRTGILSMLFFAALRSDINILGPWFFVPYTMAIPLVYLSAVFFLKGLNDKRTYLILFFAVMLAEFAVYAAYALVSTAVFTAYLVFHARSSKRAYYALTVIGGLLLSGVLGFHLLAESSLGGGLTGTLRLIADRVTFRASDEVAENIFVTHNPVATYGLLPSIMAFLGLYAVSMGVYRNRKSPILIPWVLFSLVSLLCVKLYGVTFFARHVRVLYFGMLGMVPLSAIGLDLLLGYCTRAVEATRVRHGRSLAAACAILLAGLVFLAAFSGYYTVPEYRFPYHVLERQDYDAIVWLHSNWGEGNVVLASPSISEAVYPLSRNFVVESNDLSSADPVFVRFMGGGCAEGSRIIEDNGVDFVLSRWKLGCPEYLTIVYGGGDYLYRVNKP